jgi:hypothetical protein
MDDHCLHVVLAQVEDRGLSLYTSTKNPCHPEERLSPNRCSIGRRDEGPQPMSLVSPLVKTTRLVES